MNFPSADIIVPVWNNLFETRACLAAILAYSPEARLIIVDNGSSRETELMLEEFSEPLGERALFIKSNRNIGLVPAINMGLARSDSDFSVVLRPHVIVNAGWLKALLEEAETAGAGMLSPKFVGKNCPAMPDLIPGCTLMESCTVSFSLLMLRGEMRIMIGSFDEGLDGAEWCLKEYVRRAADKGYRTFITSRSVVTCSHEALFGSTGRRLEMVNNSSRSYLDRWGSAQHYAVYFGRETEAVNLGDTIEILLDGARQGHNFTLLLHQRQYSDFRRMGWNGLHVGIKLYSLSIFFPQRDLQKKLASLTKSHPDMVPVRGSDGVAFPGTETSIPIEDLFGVILERSTNSQVKGMEVSE